MRRHASLITKRPQLDEITMWRANQIANTEQRSIPNALAVLVAEGWDRRMNHRAAKAMGVFKGDGEGATISAWVPAELIARVNRIAENETRSTSNVVMILIAEALAARNVLLPAGGAEPISVVTNAAQA